MTDDHRPSGNPLGATPPPPPPDLAPPPGYAGYDNSPTQRATSRVGGLGRAVTIVVAITAVVTLVTAALSTGAAQDAEDFLAGNISESDFESAIGPLNAVQLLSALGTAATGVLTIIWMYRIASNVRAYGRKTTWSPMFAIFGWFLPPLVLYVIPFLMLRELWKASTPTDVDGTDRWKQQPDNRLLWAWFALFGIAAAVLLGVQIGTVASGGLPSGDIESLADSLEDFSVVGWITAAVNAAAGVIWFMFVRQLTARHIRLTGES